MKKLFFILSLFICTSVNLCAQIVESENLLFVYSLHGQTRRYSTTFELHKDTLTVKWGIERNTKWQSGKYITLPQSLNDGVSLSFLQPIDKQTVVLSTKETFNIISRKAYKELKEKGSFVYGNTTFTLFENNGIGTETSGYNSVSPNSNLSKGSSSENNATSKKEKLSQKNYLEGNFANSNKAGQEILKCKQPLIHVYDNEEGCEMWILDNPSLPIIWKMKNNPLEINWEVKSDVDNIFDIKEQIVLMPEKSASTYYAYPAYSWQQTPVPAGYQPFYISHYGRHGSRWITEEKRYTEVIEAFQNVELTDLGKDVKRRLDIIYKDAKGNAGMLSPVGEKQHRDIANRMYSNFPEVFDGNKNISAYSTIVPRCIKSMGCFTGQLLLLNKNLKIKKDSEKKNMAYMSFDTPQMKEWNRKDASWRKEFAIFEKENLHSERLIKSLFVHPLDEKSADMLMMGLYWIASDMQDTNTGVSLYDIFTSDELFGIWRTINYRMYLCNGPAPINNGIPANSAVSLLKDIVDKAENAIKNGKDCATLRFGHDTNLLRLINLIDIKEYSGKESNPEKYHEAWQDFNLAPMAANLQMIFFRNDKNDILIKFMVNEKEVHLNTNTTNSPYYRWEDVNKYLKNKIEH